MSYLLVKLTCLTNLHVGNGDVNYNIVDNEVEKDPITNLPTINASGVKGALRSYIKDPVNKKDWFGSDPKEKENRTPGKIKIMSANLLARPYRATSGNKPYQLVAFQESIEQLERLCNAFNISFDKEMIQNKPENAGVEGYKLTGCECFKILGVDNIFVVPFQDTQDTGEPKAVQKLKSVDLPVISRNYLENGISQNLWYEEVVPHESVFYFFAAAEECDKELMKSFEEAINNKVIQFGANASIGYGLCKVEVMGKGELS